MSRKNYTYIDGTEICPECHCRMSGFSYYICNIPEAKAAGGGRSARKAAIEHGEASLGGTGYMCRRCYSRRRGLLFFLFSSAGALSIILLLAGIVFKSIPLGISCVIPPVILLAVMTGVVVKRRHDIRDVFNCLTDISCEFVTRFMNEHPEAMSRNCIVYAEENSHCIDEDG